MAKDEDDVVEISEELSALKDLAGEVDDHFDRLMGLHKKGTLGDVLAVEIGESVIPLLRDFVAATLQHSTLLEEGLAGLEEELDDEEEGEGGEEDIPSEEELALIRSLLVRFRMFVVASKEVPTASPEVIQNMLHLEMEIAKGLKILGRISNDEEEEKDEGDSEEDSDPDPDPDDGDSESDE